MTILIYHRVLPAMDPLQPDILDIRSLCCSASIGEIAFSCFTFEAGYSGPQARAAARP
ncbi:MAG: hypothetical protein MZV65_22245 [Chromatiales bacterium]|nr:hypothetical protein [Chromatiales bacterium]